MKTTLVLAFFAAVCTVCTVQAQDCSLVNEVNKIIAKFIREFVPDKSSHDVYCGCATAFMIGDSSKCDPKKFKLPEAKVCEDVIQHSDLKKKCVDHNVKGYESMMENMIYSNGGDADEICEKMPAEGEKMLVKIRKLQEGGGAKAKEMYDKVCKDDKKKCEEMKEMPEEIEKYIMEDMCQDFKDLIKILKNTAKSKAMPAAGAATQGIELMFGGGNFGILVSKCVNEIITITTKLGKQFQAGR